MLTVLVVGLAGYSNLGVDAFPKIDFPVVLVTTRLNGAAPEEVESQISEKNRGGRQHYRRCRRAACRNRARASALVIVTFVLDKNADIAVQEVRDHISRILFELPQGIDPPEVNKLDRTRFRCSMSRSTANQVSARNYRSRRQTHPPRHREHSRSRPGVSGGRDAKRQIKRPVGRHGPAGPMA